MPYIEIDNDTDYLITKYEKTVQMIDEMEKEQKVADVIMLKSVQRDLAVEIIDKIYGVITG